MKDKKEELASNYSKKRGEKKKKRGSFGEEIRKRELFWNPGASY